MQRKSGYDLKFWVFMLTLSAVIALILGYSRVSQEPIWFWESFLEDDLKDNLYLHLTIFLTIASFQLFFLSAKSVDNLGLTSKPLFFDYIDKAILAKKKETIFQRPLLKFRKASKKIIALIRTFTGEKKSSVMKGLMENPIMRLYILQMFFWVYINYLVFFILVEKGQTSQISHDFFKSYQCFYSKDDKCHPALQFYWTKIIQLMATLWLLAGMLQIKYGLPLFKSKIVDFDMANQIKFIVTGYMPFIREILVVCAFAANKTALNVMNWLTINDVWFIMKNAKFDQVSKDEQPFGVR